LNKHGFTDEHYDRVWSQIALSSSPNEEQRIEEILSLIPKGTSSILDVGCGDGRITNRLVSHYSKVVGLDSSQQALQHVKAERVQANIDSLPFPDRNFDLILCTEVLEHILFEDYPKVLAEIERVAASHIIVSVPYKQNLKKGMVSCPQCGCTFRPDRHVRRFEKKTMVNLFKAFRLQTIKLCQPLIEAYPPVIVGLARYLGIVSSRPHWLHALTCPQCGYALATEGDVPPTTKSKTGLRHLLRSSAGWLKYKKKYSGWFLALYRRENGHR
jgi:ubiquinone/menaquinone biosynthesis C-methylase UbiE